MYSHFEDYLNSELTTIRKEGLYKDEQVILGPQKSTISIDGSDRKILNLCANNYLGLSQHPAIKAAAKEGLEEWGYGMASVRFICGTQSIHKQLERGISQFLTTEDTILYPSCFDANGGLFEVLLDKPDAVISDELNHASIIDGIRLCKAKRFRYRNSDMSDLEEQLIEADKQGARFKLITTDGVFSMDGNIAKLDQICDLAERYQALVHVDDCHATGFIGANGRGTHELKACMDRVDIITGTLGKALGGASGGFTSGRKGVIDLLRQRSRPYLFSNSVAPAIVSGALKALELIEQGDGLRAKLVENTSYFRDELSLLGFDLIAGEHPIIPVMIHNEMLASEFAKNMFSLGVHVVPFSYPVVAKGKARIRTQMSAALTRDDLNRALEAFSTVKSKMSL